MSQQPRRSRLGDWLWLPLRLIDPRRLLLSQDVRQLRRDGALCDEAGAYFLGFTHRGEYLLYNDARGSTYVAIFLNSGCLVSRSSLQRWNEWRPMAERDRQLILDRVVRLFARQGHRCTVVP